MFAYEVKHRSGKENVAADALSRVCSVAGRPGSLKGLHESLGHPGITRLWHFVRSKNLPFPLEEVRQACLNCHTCSVLKPRFYLKPGSLQIVFSRIRRRMHNSESKHALEIFCLLGIYDIDPFNNSFSLCHNPHRHF